MDYEGREQLHPRPEKERYDKVSTRPNQISGNFCAEAPPPPDFQDIGWALTKMRAGLKVFRKGWNGKGMYLKNQFPDLHSKMSKPYVYMKTSDNHLVPWTPSQIDLFACDWEVIRE